MTGRVILMAAVVIITAIRCGRDERPKYSQETAALRAVMMLNTAEVRYYSQVGRYAASLAELGLAGGEKQGYRFALARTPAGYSISAVPTVFGSTGSRTFYSDQSLIIRQNHGPEPATADSPEVGSPRR